MALISCAECKKQISDLAPACPGCGAKRRPATSMLTWAVIGTVFVVYWAFQMRDSTSAARIVSAQGSENVRAATIHPKQKEQFATIINMNGKLCAKAIEARLSEAKRYYVECEIYPDKLERRAYYVDLETGRAE